MLDSEDAIRESLQQPQVVRHEHDRLSFCLESVECCEALLLEAFVADGENLVEEEEIEGDLDSDRVRRHR